MTGCLYISPLEFPWTDSKGVVPALLADTLITLRMHAEVQTTPANVTFDHHGKSSSVVLCRKLHLIKGDRGSCATALAGDGFLIRELVGTLADQLASWEKEAGDRPMRLYGDRATLYRERRGPIEALGIWVPDLPSGQFNSMGCWGLEEIGALGQCSAIGSGRDALLELARINESVVAAMSHAPAAERIRGFAAAVNGHRLANEFIGNMSDSTGGYIEYAYYDMNDRTWKRGPSTLHLFFKIYEEDGRNIAQLIPRAIAYDPSGHVLVVSQNINDNNHALRAIFTLEGIGEFEYNFFDEWKPDAATLTFFNEMNGSAVTTSRSTNSFEKDQIVFDWKEGEFGIKEELFRTVIEELKNIGSNARADT